MTEESEIPEGFFPFPADGSFNDACGPLYVWYKEGGAPKFALKVARHHLNPMGICHGAVYMALFDMAFPSAIGHAMGKYTGTPTMNITLNCVELAREGEWLFTEACCDRVARTAAFVRGALINGDGDIVVTATGVFKVPEDLAAVEGFTGLQQSG